MHQLSIIDTIITIILLNCSGGEVGIMGSHSDFSALGCSLNLGRMTVKKSVNISEVIYLLNQPAQFNQQECSNFKTFTYELNSI